VSAQPPAGADRFLWLHFNLANQASERWLRQRLALPDAFYESLEHSTSTRVEVAEDSLVAVFNDVTLHGVDASSASTMVLSVDPRLLVSARRTPLRSVERLREAVVGGERFSSAVELLAHLLADQAEVLVRIVRDATVQVDRIEDSVMAHRIGTSRATLGALRRMLVRLQRLLAPEPAALFRLLTRPPDWVGADDRLALRQSAEELAAAVADSVALVERVRLLQEEMGALVNEQTNRILFALTAVTVMALPLTIISGLFGMNVGGVPFGEHGAGFWLVSALAAGLAGLCGFLLLRGRRDL
jgi:zinc transporter